MFLDTKNTSEIKSHYGVKNIVLIKNHHAWGSCYYTDGIIIINSKFKNNKQKFYNILFHEIGHIYCYQNNIWKNYHLNKIQLTKREKSLILKTGLKAERWIDNWAEKEMKKWFPKMKYNKGYFLKSKTKLFKQYLKENYN